MLPFCFPLLSGGTSIWGRGWPSSHDLEFISRFSPAQALLVFDPMPAPSTCSRRPRLRVLCVHGFRTNAAIMKDQMVGFRKALGPNVEYVYLDAPFAARGDPDPLVLGLYAKTAPFYEWWQGRYLDTHEVADAISDIMSSKSDTWNLWFEDLDRSLLYMEAELRRLGPFDVAVGFSQGATMLTIFAAWSLQMRRQQWWRLAVCFAGVRVHGINALPLFEDAAGRTKLVPIPSIHIAGTSDPIYYETIELAKMYKPHPRSCAAARIVLEHDGGHRFPHPRKFMLLYASLAQMVHQFFRYSAGGAQIGARL